MAEYLIQDTTLDAIADAINAKTGGSSAMTPAEMVTAIGSISGGGVAADHAMIIDAFDSNGLPTEVTIVGDYFWTYALGSWGHNKPINKVNAPDVVYLGTECMRLLKGNNMQDLVLPKVEYFAGADTIYDCNFPRIFLPLLCTTSSTNGAIYDTVMSYVEMGSLNHPVIYDLPQIFFRGLNQSFDIVIYTDKTSLADAQAFFVKSPWNATNATIIFKNSVTGEVLT